MTALLNLVLPKLSVQWSQKVGIIFSESVLAHSRPTEAHIHDSHFHLSIGPWTPSQIPLTSSGGQKNCFFIRHLGKLSPLSASAGF